MKIDCKFWFFMLVLVLTQSIVIYSLNLRITRESNKISSGLEEKLDSNFHDMVNELSSQMACMLGEQDFCLEGGK